MAGLFDILSMFGPNSAQAAEGWAGNPTGGITPEQLLGSQAAQNAVVPEVNPNPVAPGTIPLPVPVPPEAKIVASPGGPADVPGTTTLNRGVTEPDVMNPGAVGAQLTGNGLPPDPTSLAARAPALGAEGPTAPDPAEANAQAPGGRPSLAQALKGTTGIKPPEVQKISSPNAPRATGTIKSGELQALLMALNAGGAMPQAKPVRLGG